MGVLQGSDYLLTALSPLAVCLRVSAGLQHFCKRCFVQLLVDTMTGRDKRCRWCADTRPSRPQRPHGLVYMDGYATPEPESDSDEEMPEGADDEIDDPPPAAPLLPAAPEPAPAASAPPSPVAAPVVAAPLPPSPPSASASASSSGAGPAAPAGPPLAFLSAEPLVSLAADPVACWQLHQYALFRAGDLSRELAASLLVLMGAWPRTRLTKVIAGDVRQFDLATWAAFEKSQLKPDLNALFRSLLDQLGVVAPEAHAAPKLLAAPPGRGLQAVHFDAFNGPWLEVEKITVVLYLTDGAQTTAVPRWPASAFQPREDSAASMRACAPLLSREFFHSVAAHPGDVMIFSQRVPHFGTQNPAGHDRQALFSMYSPSADPDQDDRQVRLAHCARAASGLRVRLLHFF